MSKNKQANNIYTRFFFKKIMILATVIFINLLSTKIQAIDLKYESTDLEIFDGYGGVAMTDWNNTVDGDKIIYVSRGETPKLNHINNDNIFTVSVANLYNTDLGKFGFYIRYDYMNLFSKEDNVFWADGNLDKKIKTIIKPSYLGFGLKYYVYQNKTCYPKIDCICNVDLGLMTTFGSTSLDAYLNDGSLYFHRKFDYIPEESLNFSGNLGMGAHFWFFDNVGISILGGWKSAQTYVQGKYSENTDSNLIGQRSWYVIDYSGFFVSVGLVARIWQ